ncbi:MAG TPA: glycosyltransferase [Isosphaeraceae bacterium]|nr:glycosyltransferase [Isosphaeraceae bacterium]HKM71889.1 glycosyltransferase [Stellaceae bacterium]
MDNGGKVDLDKAVLSGTGELAPATLRSLLRGAIALGDWAQASPKGPVLRATWAPGVSVVIPECGTPELLKRALDHLRAAVAGLAEPWEIIVIVNGAPAGDYRWLQDGYPEVRWQFHRAPLGFSGAIAPGLAAARFGGIYLHNSDIALEPPALAALLSWRAASVFAIASQIFFDDPEKRREETGWGDLRLHSGRSELFERSPEPDGLVRGGLYPSGGSSLYDAGLLRQFAADTWSYAPFYFEDADWGLQAWRNGLEVLFHPGSVAWHRHRATVSRLYAPDEIERIVARNSILFDLRNQADPARALCDAEASLPATLKELTSGRSVTEISLIRAARRRAPFPDIDLERTTQRVYARPATADGRPLVLVATPYCILPPRHGGAWRTWRLCDALRDRWRFILLTDEATAHDSSSWAHVGPFDSVHLIGGRPDGPTDRIGRILSHSHRALQAELDRLAAVHQPDLVQIEHAELAGLRPPLDLPCLLAAHDVLLDGQDREADLFERERLSAFTARVVCSKEDAQLLAPLSVTVVPNGAVITAPRCSSAGNRLVLFAGPFRYTPNLEGVREFLAIVFPALRRRFPDVELAILGGRGARTIAAADPLLLQAGVTVEEHVDDVGPWLDRSALTINPLVGTRGSSVKLIESLAAARVCVSTADGARGFLDSGLPGLVVASDIPAMGEPIGQLLADEPRRLALENAEREKLRAFSWGEAAVTLERVYRELLRREAETP